MKLEVGMYVRIQWGNGVQTISKCEDIHYMGDTQYSLNDFYIHTDKRGEVIYKSMILKASHNIIDLIEVGDYVNGEIVNEKWKGVVLVGQECRPISFNNIKSIVTKEQFEAMAYKVV